MKKNLLFWIIILQCKAISFSQNTILRDKITSIINAKNAKVGVSILDLSNGDTLTVNKTHHFPMQSVYKFHLALAVLDQVDKGKFSLNQNILVKKSDLLPNLYSPMREKYPEGNVNLPLSEILKYTVAQSDNSGCDLLFRLLGGPQKVNNYIHKIGVKEVNIVAPEEEMQKDWQVQYANWSTPIAATQLLQKFYQTKILSKNSQDFLWKTMVETTTGPNKIRGLLPKETVVAHKTGFSGKNDVGLTGATNDIGIIILPNGQKLAIALFVSNSTETEITNDRIIAEITKVVWDYYVF
ncbi:class A beta-lactamase, subclass A2 [Arcicella sp. LKC2W]|uniref:class A beta-lactamase, subclass A2 n=1 Tax=Arcicella sp. LKC2W TaxID=2984198 RepID=UPI002B218DBA|nr:class A beta-lactamase, subclass A2 [Arcicella sp. LKC2W]MEA5461991.1 class A beta-lactamase, subclass A2 [Arcicella sp. LKC2W]